MKHMLLLILGGLLFAAGVRQASATNEPVSRAGTARTADGVPIRYEVRGRGDPALVFIHGWASDRSVWQEQVNIFARGHTLVTVDLGGHGASGANRASWSIASLAQDVVTVVKALGLKRVVLIGHSMGGPVALLAAGRMPDRILGVIGVDTLHNAELLKGLAAR